MAALTSLGASIDSFLATYVTTVSERLAIVATPVAATAFTMWIMLYGYAVARQEVSEPVHVFVKRIFKLALIASVALFGGIYQSHIVSAVHALQTGLSTVVSSPMGGAGEGSRDMLELLDAFTDKSMELAFVMLQRGMAKMPIGGWLDLVAGLTVMVGTVILEVIAGGFSMVVRVALAIVLALGPIFILCLAFPATVRFFDAWLGKTINYVLLGVVLAACTGLAVSVCDSYVQHALEAAQAEAANPLADAFGLIAIEGVLAVLMFQAPQIASGLGGGAAVSGGGVGQFIAGQVTRGITGGLSLPSFGPSSGGHISRVGTEGTTSRGGTPSGSQPDNRVPAYRRAARNRYGGGRR